MNSFLSLKRYVDAVCSRWTGKKLVAVATAVTAILSYYLLLLKDFQNPDGYGEGFILYHNADWASANGRWLQRYMELGTFNVVMPLFVVVGYTVCLAISINLVIDLLHIKNAWNIVAISIVMTAAPAVIEQMTYTYMALAYAFSLLFTVLYVYFVTRFENIAFKIFGSVCLCMAMGLYQSYIGVSIGLAVMVLVMEAFDNGINGSWWRRFGGFLWTGALGILVYFIAVKVDMSFYSVAAGARMQQVGLLDSLICFPDRLGYAYQCFFNYFLDWRIKRKWMYTVFFIFFAGAFIVALIRLISQKKWKETFGFCVMTGVIPMALNSIAFICIGDDIRNLMSYQMVLVMPFGIALLERCYRGKAVFLQALAALVCLMIGWTYVISSNMTYRCWDLSNRRIHFVTENIMSDVVSMPEYEEGKRIIFAGFIDDSVLRNEYWLLYQHAFGMDNHVICWNGASDLMAIRRYILMNFGVDAGNYSLEEYYKIIDSDIFAEMGVYPRTNAIAEIDGIIVVKLSDNPPR